MFVCNFKTKRPIKFLKFAWERGTNVRVLKADLAEGAHLFIELGIGEGRGAWVSSPPPPPPIHHVVVHYILNM